ncbi:MAG: tetratricopeptide repeat protein [Anaerolineae bacterium]
MTNDLTFGQWLKRRRQALGMTREDLAGRIGYSVGMLRKVEGDERTPSLQFAQLLAEHLAIVPEERAAFFSFARDDLAIESTPLPVQSAIAVPASPARVTNLPAPLTSLIGRQQEVAAVRALLLRDDLRLLTLAGPGGTGKTRLALHVAAELVDEFPDGAFFVNLAPVVDPNLVPSVIAETLRLHDRSSQSPLEMLKNYLQEKRLLLLLDNFEQVTEGSAILPELLRAASGVKMLATSREVLGVSGEHVYPVPPLALPHDAGLPFLEQAHYPAVRLFIERAQVANIKFAPRDDNLPDIVEVCRRLDGLPLAIELAAARVRILTPQAILQELPRRLDLLKGGPRDWPARHKTLRDAIGWSYDLLTEDDKTLFRRLAVFAGGWTLDAAGQVCNAEGDLPAVLDGLISLVDKSLVTQAEQPDGEPRFRMLETIREYAEERLQQSGGADVVRRRHAAWCLSLADEASLHLTGPRQQEWLDRLAREHDNMRTALDWCMGAGEAELGLRLAAALGEFWALHAHLDEGRMRLARALAAAPAHGPDLTHARALDWASVLAYHQCNYAVAQAQAGEALALYRALGNRRGESRALDVMGDSANEMGDYVTGTALFEEALDIAREMGDTHQTASMLRQLGWAAMRVGDYALAESRLEEATAKSRLLGDAGGVAFCLSGLGELAAREVQYERARILLEESLVLRRVLNYRWGIGATLGSLGWVALEQQDWVTARARLAESLAVRQELGDMGGAAWCLERLADMALTLGDAERAVRLWSAAATLRTPIGSVIDPADQPEHERNLAAARAALGEAAFAAAWAASSAWTLKQAIAHATEDIIRPGR